MGSALVRVAVIDDEPAVRSLLRHRLPFEGAFVVVAEGGSGDEAIEVAKREQPDLMILDVVMPGMTGIAALPHVVAAAPHCKIILYSALEPTSRNPRSVGAHGFVNKTESYATLPTVLRQLFPDTCASSETATGDSPTGASR